MALLVRGHVRGGLLRGVDKALEVGVDQLLHVRRRVVADRLGDEYAGVVDQHIHPAEMLYCGCEQLLRGFRQGDIAGNADEARPGVEFLRGRLQACIGARIGHHVVALGQKSFGQRVADTAGSAGDDDGLVAHDDLLNR